MSLTLSNPSAFEEALEAAFHARSKTNEAQASAFDRFGKLRLPHRRLEGWKWTDFNAALRAVKPGAVETPVVAPSPFAALAPLEFRIVGGRIEIPDEKMPAGIRYGVMDSVATIDELERHPIASLNVALTRKSLALEVLEGVNFERPILIRHINAGAGFSFSQTMMRISPNAKAQLIETYEGEGAGFYSHLFHVAVRDGASFQRAMLHETDGAGVIHGICAAKIDEKASFSQTSLSRGARLSRHESHLHFWAPDSAASLASASLLSGENHADFTSEALFRAENCAMRQLHKGVARDRGRNVFQGKFHVFREAQKTDAKMTANALLLSDSAEANHKPELEIYADDVACAHGSTVGALDEDVLFYLRQRGLDEAQARAIHKEAYVGEVAESIENDNVREIFSARVKQWLEQQ